MQLNIIMTEGVELPEGTIADIQENYKDLEIHMQMAIMRKPQGSQAQPSTYNE